MEIKFVFKTCDLTVVMSNNETKNDKTQNEVEIFKAGKLYESNPSRSDGLYESKKEEKKMCVKNEMTCTAPPFHLIDIQPHLTNAPNFSFRRNQRIEPPIEQLGFDRSIESESTNASSDASI